jgi:hypothetical protein
MGNFFRTEYDLYVEIVGNAEGMARKLIASVGATKGDDSLAEDIKDSCQTIAESNDYQHALKSGALEFLMNMLSETIGINKIHKQ